MSEPARIATVALAGVTLAVAVVVRFDTGGWMIFPGAPFYALIGIWHIAAHRLAATSSPEPPRILGGRFVERLAGARGWRTRVAGSGHRGLAGWIVASNVLLLVAFLLQWDQGDGPEWLTITALIGQGPGYSTSSPPSWWPSEWGLLVNVALFIPVALTWRAMVRAAARSD